MAVPILLFLAGFILLIKGGDWFVDGATGIAKKFHIPDLLIGATIVSIGTTLPEVMVSATSAFTGHGEIAYGNAIGSIIFNTGFIAGLVIIFRPSNVERKSLILPTIVFFISATLYSVVAYAFGNYSRLVGGLLVGIFVIYIALSVYNAKKATKMLEPSEKIEDETEITTKNLVIFIIKLVLGAAAIAFGSRLLVDNGIIIAEAIGVPESVIGLTFIAVGTSLPELVTAITSLIKGHGALSLGNVIGANIFNIVLVGGVSILISPFTLPASKILWGINSSLIIDVPVMLLVMVLLTIPALIRKKLSRVQGVLLMIVYVAFATLQFVI